MRKRLTVKFVHTNIVAKEWKKLAQFYIDVFGCTPKPPERHLVGKWLDQATGLDSAELRGIHLSLPGFEDNGPTLEIFTYTSMEDPCETFANRVGFSHIAFLVDDVDSVFKKAIRQGGQVLGKVTEKEISNVGHLTFVYLKDPEGNIVEIQSWD
jgi:predicted enzyme related to lactoylglutathione lyase